MLDPENNRFDLFIVDGASNVQVVGNLLRLFLIGFIISRGQIMFCLSSLTILQIYLR